MARITIRQFKHSKSVPVHILQQRDGTAAKETTKERIARIRKAKKSV